MTYYASKTAVLNALNQKTGEREGLEEKKRLLQEAYSEIVRVFAEVDKLQTELSGWISSLNAFGSFSWEGTRVQEVQRGARENQYAWYSIRLLSWRDAIEQGILQTGTDLATVQGDIDNLRWQYNNWEANHPVSST
jgi:hypothetical protein